MKLREMLQKNRIEIGAELCSKDEVLKRLSSLQSDNDNPQNTALLTHEIEAREKLGSSAVSGRVAIPCVRHSGAEDTRISVVTLKSDVDFGAPDKRGVRLVFLIAGRDKSDEEIEVKSRLMHLLMDSEFTARLCSAKSADEFLEVFEEREKIRYAPWKPDKRYDCSRFLERKYRKRRTQKG